VKTIDEAFEVYLGWKTPTDRQRSAAAKHRNSVTSSVTKDLDVYRFIETGSFTHGTGVAGHSDVDILVSLKENQPASSDTALSWIRTALVNTFPNTHVHVSRPAVVVPFANGYETFEIIPGFRNDSEIARFSIPAPGGEWMDTTPQAHLDYVSAANAKPRQGAKRLARLLKSWKYSQSVPVSSFYLEMRAAQHMRGEETFLAIADLWSVLERLDRLDLASMQDPTGNSGLIRATSSPGAAETARSKTHTAAVRAKRALDAWRDDDAASSFHYLDLLFNGGFPSRY